MCQYPALSYQVGFRDWSWTLFTLSDDHCTVRGTCCKQGRRVCNKLQRVTLQTLLPCSPCLGSVGQCSGQWGLNICLCHGHLWFLVDLPLWNNSVPVAPWLLPSGFIPGRDGHVQRQFCTQMGLNGTLGIGTLGIGFLLSPQRTPRKTGSSNYLVCRSCRDRMEYVGRK